MAPHSLLVLLAAVLLVANANAKPTSPHSPKSSGRATIVAPDQLYSGRSYTDLTEASWLYDVQFPLAVNPTTVNGDVDCARGQTGPVWFLSGASSFNGGTFVRSCTVPKSKALFVRVRASLYWTPEDDSTLAGARAQNNEWQSAPNSDNIAATIDGNAVEDIYAYRVQSHPGGFALPNTQFFVDLGFPNGVQRQGVSDGYWLLLKPLSRGTHVIRITAASNNLDVTYNLNVE